MRRAISFHSRRLRVNFAVATGGWLLEGNCELLLRERGYTKEKMRNVGRPRFQSFGPKIKTNKLVSSFLARFSFRDQD